MRNRGRALAASPLACRNAAARVRNVVTRSLASSGNTCASRKSWCGSNKRHSGHCDGLFGANGNIAASRVNACAFATSATPSVFGTHAFDRLYQPVCTEVSRIGRLEDGGITTAPIRSARHASAVPRRQAPPTAPPRSNDAANASTSSVPCKINSRGIGVSASHAHSRRTARNSGDSFATVACQVAITGSGYWVYPNAPRASRFAVASR